MKDQAARIFTLSCAFLAAAALGFLAVEVAKLQARIPADRSAASPPAQPPARPCACKAAQGPSPSPIVAPVHPSGRRVR